MDFSRVDAVVGQHLLHFNHDLAVVRCEFSRSWRFPVDEMFAETDGTYVPGTSQLLHIDGKRKSSLNLSSS